MEPLSSKYIVLGYSGLCRREGYIIIKQSVTVCCFLLYFGLVLLLLGIRASRLLPNKYFKEPRRAKAKKVRSPTDYVLGAAAKL